MKRFALPVITIVIALGLGLGFGLTHTGTTAAPRAAHTTAFLAGQKYAARYMQAYLAGVSEQGTTSQIWCNSRAVEVSHPEPSSQWVKGCETGLASS